MTTEVCKISEEELGIPQNKIYVKYEEVENWGWNGRNFQINISKDAILEF